MPNHVTNIIEISGDRLHVDELLERIKDDEQGVGSIDFDKIIPMPESLGIQCGSDTDSGLRAYKEFISACMFEDGVKTSDMADITEERERDYLATHDVTPEQWELGKIAFHNIKQYGFPTWYEWSIANRGTKWNAYQCSYDSRSGKMRFLTAWSAPHPVVEALAGMYPDVDFVHEWADEDVGQNCGRYEYSEGCRGGEYFPESEKDCIEFACSVMQRSPEDYELILNAACSKYIPMEHGEYELIELFGKPALFADERLTSVDIPNGLYCYHLRESDDGSHFATIEPIVMINHGGTVITDEPIDFGERGFIEFTDDTYPNFLGYDRTFGEYMRGEFEMEEGFADEQMGGMDL